MTSAALAVPPLVSTTTGRFGHGCGFASRYVLDVVGARPRVSTTSCPGSRNSSLTATPWSSKPPGLPRRSSTSDFIPFWTKPFTASVRSWADVSLTGVSRTYPTLSSSIIETWTERMWIVARVSRSEEHTSELQSQSNLVCRLLLEKKKNQYVLRCFIESVRRNRLEHGMR